MNGGGGFRRASVEGSNKRIEGGTMMGVGEDISTDPEERVAA